MPKIMQKFFLSSVLNTYWPLWNARIFKNKICVTIHDLTQTDRVLTNMKSYSQCTTARLLSEKRLCKSSMEMCPWKKHAKVSFTVPCLQLPLHVDQLWSHVTICEKDLCDNTQLDSNIQGANKYERVVSAASTKLPDCFQRKTDVEAAGRDITLCVNIN